MDYFDSLRACSDNLAFLDARAHYIKGVGSYERDSVVDACREYLQALEVMEDRFDEKELTGHKARFMALTCTHLCKLFSDQYLHDQAIYFGKESLAYYHRYNAPLWHVSWVLDHVGSHYLVMKELDSADCYFRYAMEILPDTTSLIYRDIATVKATLAYSKDKDPQFPLKRLRQLIGEAESNEEYLSRCASIGEIYYQENQNDSAWKYLSLVFHGTTSIASKKQVAEWLGRLCQSQGKTAEMVEYTSFLAPFANLEENKSEMKSQLSELYSAYHRHGVDKKHRTIIKKHFWMSLLVIGSLVVVLLMIGFLYYSNLRKKRNLETKYSEEQYANEMRIKAIGGRLRESNEALRLQIKETQSLQKQLKDQLCQTRWNSMYDFLKEDICQEIIASFKGKHIKREAKSNDYPELFLTESQLVQLSTTVEKNFSGFGKLLADMYPKIRQDELNQCMLYLVGMDDAQIAAILHCDYSTIKKRSSKLRKAFGTDKELKVFVREFVL